MNCASSVECALEPKERQILFGNCFSHGPFSKYRYASIPFLRVDSGRILSEWDGFGDTHSGQVWVNRFHTLLNRQAIHIIYFTYPQTRNLEECEEVWIRIADPILESRDLNQSKSNQIRKILNKTLFEIPQ